MLPISDRFASEVYITNADVDWGSEALLVSLLSGKGVFLDVGSHIGYYGLYVLPKVTGVICFEPDPRVRVFLEQNLAGRPNAEVLPLAVGATEGSARFTLAANSEVSHLSRDGEGEVQQIQVDVICLDSFVASRALCVEAIKIDVEGHDLEVIRGALSLLAEQAPIVLTEAAPEQSLFNLLAPVAYRVFAYVRDPQTRVKSFMELTRDAPLPGAVKMLFLVPASRVEEFKRKTR